ncbi:MULTISPECIES: response regulator transcription factor [Exiguobacterium]|uniref:Response regulator transcription factor n=1 Tax=Exiguobacterium marinum TaxID=273528 RepID=A0ABY7WXD6_9BACL|nr:MULTISPECIES: response regulator transcription factor [Exiguobacterium]WDH75519.1 response regulator transcription factor [Exiguobacterium marinum]
MPTIAIVEDEKKIARFVAANLLSLGYEVKQYIDGSQFLEEIERNQFDLVLLDIMMPRMDGFEVLRRLRTVSDIPVILLTARSQSKDKVDGLNLGADDYLTKPFALEELFARVKAVLRRSVAEEVLEMTVHIKGVEIDRLRNRVFHRGEEVKLTQNEFSLLSELGKHLDQVVQHRELLQSVWGPEYGEEVEYLRVTIGRIRKKLKAAGATEAANQLKTYPGIGYALLS